jgi:hypothetical protein
MPYVVISYRHVYRELNCRTLPTPILYIDCYHMLQELSCRTFSPFVDCTAYLSLLQPGFTVVRAQGAIRL